MAATDAIITFKASIYDPDILGVYVVTIAYNWNRSPTYTNTITVTLIDPCLIAVIPPATIVSSTYNMGDANSSTSLAPTITIAYRGVCLYSISIVSTKLTSPDTSSDVVSFTTMTNSLYATISNAKV